MFLSRLPAFFLVAFLVAGFLIGAPAAWRAAEKTPEKNYENIVKGHWTLAFDKKFPEALPFYVFSRDVWGVVDYVLFREGRKGVIVGDKGWLFTDEEFSVWPQARDNIKSRLERIEAVHARLKEKDIVLVVALLPAKSRLYPGHIGSRRWPAAHEETYGEVFKALKEKNIPVVDVYDAFRQAPDRDALFLKTDTHWTPAGARVAAQAIARTLAASIPGVLSSDAIFNTKKGETRDHSGDLMRYIPLGSIQVPGAPAADRLEIFSTEKAAADGAASESLFGEESLPVALVGTSYSANPSWNFAGFLKEALKTDVLNAADEGRGPFVTMDAYLKSNPFLETPPKVVIWEIPERYLPMPGKTEEQKGKED